MNLFSDITTEIDGLIRRWEPRLLEISNDILTIRKNSQNRTIKQIVGHMADSATNNTHRVIHLQYQNSPLNFPNYATFGNNDRWIAIQNYQSEEWPLLLSYWKYTNLHFCHVIKNIDPEKLNEIWDSGANEFVTLKDMVIDYTRHLKLHFSEIEDLLK